MLNKIWGGMIIFALLAALGQDLGMYKVPDRISGEEDIEVIQETSELALKSLTNSIFASASTAVKIAINLIGIIFLKINEIATFGKPKKKRIPINR